MDQIRIWLIINIEFEVSDDSYLKAAHGTAEYKCLKTGVKEVLQKKIVMWS